MMLKLSARYICPLILMMTPSLPAWALCCPGDIKEPMSAGSGIGQVQPPETDVSLDRQWAVHTFERDGVGYLQVSEKSGDVQFIIGKSGSFYWVLPAGPNDTSITLPSDHGQTAPIHAREVYRHPEFRLLVSGWGRTATWWVEDASQQLAH
ncbi:hypothetical protein [Stenotrophomonas rhizophila]|uniref:hypothetical protein n=1 Tax=Stenotrophomonas rhizophila TaxID=216778 RepID=UPI000ED0BACC|nr:hypothetical protein [Stenotrophomonas rhizophila]HCQ46278.1 hypothetical protein [Achromobacter sp.]